MDLGDGAPPGFNARVTGTSGLIGPHVFDPHLVASATVTRSATELGSTNPLRFNPATNSFPNIIFFNDIIPGSGGEVIELGDVVDITITRGNSPVTVLGTITQTITQEDLDRGHMIVDFGTGNVAPTFEIVLDSTAVATPVDFTMADMNWWNDRYFNNHTHFLTDWMDWDRVFYAPVLRVNGVNAPATISSEIRVDHAAFFSNLSSLTPPTTRPVTFYFELNGVRVATNSAVTWNILP